MPTSAMGQDFDSVQIAVVPVTGSIYMLQGSGGNIGVIVGADGTFIVDDQYAPLTDKIADAIEGITDDPVDFVINTHWHFDHTGGNENFGGMGAVIVSHENSRRRMTTDQLVELFDTEQSAYSPEGLPKITFDESVRFHLNGETIDVFYVGPAHTDGDAVVYFRESNVMHTGDVFVRYGLPFIDQPNGGDVDGIVEAVAEIARRTDAETVFIPGHGPLSSREDLLAFGDMVATIRDRVREGIAAGRSFDEIVASNPTRGYPEEGIETRAFVRLVYDSLVEGR
ncbi:MAG: MBL fold metallo-hydrolase [Gemmatimonadetes bacterium]|nr:MBL fold metallo-hydrolase [Gemmatimonadota bacterium]